MYEIVLLNMHEPILPEIKIEITSYKLPLLILITSSIFVTRFFKIQYEDTRHFLRI